MKILTLQMNDEFHALAHELGIETKVIQKDELYETIETILSDEKENNEPLDFEYPLIYMSDMSEQQMNLLSAKMKERQIPACIQVGQTEHNLRWVLNDLLNEIVEEHHTFLRRDELMNLIRKGIHIKKEDQAEKLYLEQMLMQAYMLLQVNSERKDLEEMIEKLKLLIGE